MSVDMEENVAGALCYVLTWLTGIIFLVIEKKNNFIRFHAYQSIITFLPLTILAWIIGSVGASTFWYTGYTIFSTLSTLIWLLTLLLWLLLMYKAYQGERFKLPIVGDIAENQL
ncbi:MAG: DUF4870 domain-containing protein [Hadesarchaea archaeon]|nr:DUF4870 domain-containing protein [Hadesarchaea archaeon]